MPPQVSPTANASSSEYPNVHTFGVPLVEHRERLGDDRALDAAARHRARHLAVLVHGHRGARVPRTGALHADHPRDRHPPAGGLPAVDVRNHFFHRAITSASCSRARSEWPSMNSSTNGRAAAIPRARGA